MACKTQNAKNMILYGDRGSHYTSQMFRESLTKYGAIQSMRGTRRYYENARMESFFATLKKKNYIKYILKSCLWKKLKQ